MTWREHSTGRPLLPRPRALDPSSIYQRQNRLQSGRERRVPDPPTCTRTRMLPAGPGGREGHAPGTPVCGLFRLFQRVGGQKALGSWLDSPCPGFPGLPPLHRARSLFSAALTPVIPTVPARSRTADPSLTPIWSRPLSSLTEVINLGISSDRHSLRPTSLGARKIKAVGRGTGKRKRPRLCSPRTTLLADEAL